MNGRLTAKFTSAFSRDLKKKSAKRQWNLDELEAVIDLILENSRESLGVLKQRHRMHKPSGQWGGSNECHMANVGDWLVIWRICGQVAYFQRTGTHYELFRR